jgi:hypothetical protein
MKGKSKKKMRLPIISTVVYRQINTFIGIFSTLIEIPMTALILAFNFGS